MNDNLYSRKDPVHRVLDVCLYVVCTAGVSLCAYLIYQAM